MERYSIINEKNKREIVLLRGRGCQYRRCRFCDYHLDYSLDEKANFFLNKEVLCHVTGKYHQLEAINSGSFVDLDMDTIEAIIEVCKKKKITTLHVECHYIHKDNIPSFRKRLEKEGITLKVKIGVETFDWEYREGILKKGIPDKDPMVIAKEFDEVCLLFGLKGQTVESMEKDIKTGLKYFERVCINIMVENSTVIKPDKKVIEAFVDNIYPQYIDNDRVDILLNNTDFGVGGQDDE